MHVTPQQVLMAMAGLGWTRRELAKAADLGESTVRDWLAGHRDLRLTSYTQIVGALERAGVRFVPGGAVIDD